MNAQLIYSMLNDACRALEESGEHVIAAYVGQGMALIDEKYALGHERIDDACRH
ncbi:hypothetical protein [Sphingomonas ginsenosidivorax]|uniref:hypothetical protein n=1 Tax=Sphingomonas ginsenosidivorax TaxID=862135 RepID=UPI001315447A|nr:hypothetical protein [Sphingomonas ginsenosidivorax]